MSSVLFTLIELSSFFVGACIIVLAVIAYENS